jgi:hypothetical protein
MRALRTLRAGSFASIGVAALLGPSSFVHTQSSSPAAVGGTVTGHVTCGDTQRPARFAQVVLFGVPAEISLTLKPDAPPNNTRYMDVFKAYATTSMVQSQTDVDGNFLAEGVAPGDYYVFASVPGYVLPRNILLAASEAGSDLRKAIPGIPMVHVVPEHPAQAELTVERGAALAGKVIWDDGSPATHVTVSILTKKDKKQELPPQFEMASLEGAVTYTDDLGQFRIAGMLPGEYLVKASLQTNTRMTIQKGVTNLKGVDGDSPLTAYAPAAFHQAEAKPITLHAGEERDGVELTVNLSGLHSVTGRVASMEDHHGINSGRVRLEDTQDKEFWRSTGVDADGGFRVTFVPSGTYNLRVTDAADTEPSLEKPNKEEPLRFASEITLRSYADGKQSVIVTNSDVTGQNVELAPLKTAKKELEPTD